MAYATNEERKALKDMVANGIDNLPFVVRFKKGERENELHAGTVTVSHPCLNKFRQNFHRLRKSQNYLKQNTSLCR